MVEIKCNCKTCKANAALLGIAAPLRAEAPQVLIDAVKGKVHGLVDMAHDPNAITGAAARARTGVRAL